MGYEKTLLLHLSVTGLILLCSSGPVPQPQAPSPNKIQDLKSKLETLQRLLQELNKQDTETTNSPTTQKPTQAPTTVSHDQKVENVPSELVANQAGGINQDITPDTLKNLVSQLTPEDIETLRQVRERLVTLKGLLQRQQQQQQSQAAHGVRPRPQSRTYIEPMADKRSNQVDGVSANFPHYGKTYDDGKFLNGPVDDSLLGLGKVEPGERQMRGYGQRAVDGHFLPVETSNGRFGPILRELHRQNVLHTVKKRLLEGMKYAHDNGVSLRDVLQSLTQPTGQQESLVEDELKSLT